MAAVFRAFCRATAVLVAVPFLAFAATLTPTHVHEADADHAQTIVHSHFDAHHGDAHGLESEIEGGEHIVWLDASVLHGTLFQIQQPALFVARVIVPAPLADQWSVVSVHEGAPAHGPPRLSTALRAPPFLPV